MDTVSATSFKARCLRLLDEVAEAGSELVITKRGRPVARVVPFESEASMEGSVRFLADEEELFSTGEAWEAERPRREGGREPGG